MVVHCPSIFLAAVFLAAAMLSSVATIDLTVSPGTNGQAVVQAVVDLIHYSCVFENDKNFLRRLAFVESRDGGNGNTYRYQYDGGIWQVDENKFLSTKTLSYATRHFEHIRGNFSIEWLQVTWSDLRKPLYSGLAARLYIEVMLRGNDIPSDIDQQSILWHNSYHDFQPSPTANFTSAANLLEAACYKSKQLDAVFLLDSSGSVDQADFNRAKEFVVRWIDAFTIGEDATRVGVITFSSRAVVDIYLPNYPSKSALIKKVLAINYMVGGTDTASAIDLAMGTVLSTRYGARSQVGRAIILITDGQSNEPLKTKAAAQRAKDAQITMFSVGVGSIDTVELNAVATSPSCMHVFYVSNYGEIDVIKQQMQEASCKTSIQLGPNEKTNNTNTTNGIVCELGDQCNTISVDTNVTGSSTSAGHAVVTTVNCGSATVYASYNNPNPGVAYYELKAVATNSTPAVLLLNNTGRILYISVEGHPYRIDLNHTISCEAVTTLVDKTELPSGTGEVKVVCSEWGKDRECSPKDLSKFKPILCEEKYEFNSPCTRANLMDGQVKFPYIGDHQKYLMCDLVGDAYVVQCPRGRIYNPDLKSCGLSTGSPGHTTGTRSPLDPKETNPCTINAIFARHMQFAYIKDNTKFIICDVWGGAWLYECHDGFIWDSQSMQCVVQSAVDHVQGPGPLDKTVPNPCTLDNLVAGHLFFVYPLATDRYIQCDVWGDAFVMLCFLGGNWNVEVGACTAGNSG